MKSHPRDSAARPRPGQGKNPKGKGADKAAEAGAERTERVAKALARAGVASRREVERLINLGKVAVNGRVLDSPANLVKRDDIITVDGKVVNGPEPARVWRHHKPAGLVTTHKDPQGRPTVFEHLPADLPRVISVGRLDLNSEGLLLLTNDGGLARALEMPATAVRRVYRARAYGKTTQAELDRLKDGITLEGVRYGSIDAKLDKAETKADGRANLWITVALAEGKNREVRRVLEALGLKVNRLIRVAYGPFQLGTLDVGDVEEVGPRVIRELLAEHIAPENLPSGDRTPKPSSAKPGRRPTADAPGAPRGTGDPIADPNRKPSRTRAQLAAAREALEKEPERPVRDSSERPSRPGSKFGGERRPRPHGSSGDKPWRSDGPKRSAPGGYKGGERSFRRDEEGGSDRPARPDRERRPRPAAAEGDKPWRSEGPKRSGPGGFKGGGYKGGGERSFRRDDESGSDRPARPDRERRPRPAGAEGDKPWRSEGPKRSGPGFKGGADRPPRRDGERRPRAEGAGGDKPWRSDKPQRSGPGGGFKGGGKDRPARSNADRPYRSKEGGEGGAGRPERGGGKPRFDKGPGGGDRPTGARGPRPQGGGGKGGGFKGPRPGGGARPKGPRRPG